MCVLHAAWNLKLLFAICTDSFKPFGMRRKPYMLAGWGLILAVLLLIASMAKQLNAHTWISLSMLIQFCVMIADVPGTTIKHDLHKHIQPPSLPRP